MILIPLVDTQAPTILKPNAQEWDQGHDEEIAKRLRML